jgi:hypothetical protein
MNEKLSRSLARFCSLCRSDSAQSMEGVWPQPALNLRARIEQLVASHTLHNTTYGKRLRAAAATLNTSSSPDAKARFCGGGGELRP